MYCNADENVKQISLQFRL